MGEATDLSTPTGLAYDRPDVAFEHFGRMLKDVGVARADEYVRTAQVLVAFLGANSIVRDVLRGELRSLLALEERWYESLRNGEPDYEVYADEAYLPELWACWAVYSRRYVREIVVPTRLPPSGVVADLGDVRRVLDVGCGLGYSTGALAQTFPGAEVIGTNVSAGAQIEVARSMADQYGFTLTDQLGVGDVDVVFASEYLEHFQRPVDELRDILKTRPRALLFANTFGPNAIGHFDEYAIDGELLANARSAARAVDAELVAQGYEKVKTKIWNSRPTYWRKIDA